MSKFIAAAILLLLPGCASIDQWYTDGEEELPRCGKPPCMLGAQQQEDQFWAQRSSARQLGFKRQ